VSLLETHENVGLPDKTHCTVRYTVDVFLT
jgi:hypothetical protein